MECQSEPFGLAPRHTSDRIGTTTAVGARARTSDAGATVTDMSEPVQPLADVEQLYRDSREGLTAYFLRRHRSTHAAEDLLHETFLQLMRRVDRCRAARSPQAYLFGSELTREATRQIQQKRLDEIVDRMEAEIQRTANRTARAALSKEDADTS